MSDIHGYGVFGKRQHIIKIDHDMAERAFSAMYGVWTMLLKKEAGSRRRKQALKMKG